MKTFKNIIIYSLIGIGLGNFFQLLFLNLNSASYETILPALRTLFSSDLQTANIQTLIYALIGISQGFASKVFKTNYTLITQTLLHYLCIISPLLFLGLIIFGKNISILSLLAYLISVSLVYIVAYIFMYIYAKYEIKKINSKLQ